MAAYATIAQYIARFGAVENEDMLSECLEDATAAINAALDKAGIDYSEPSAAFSERLMRVCRSAANRIYPADSGADFPQGIDSASISAVGFSQSYSFSASYGTPKLLPSELQLLGIAGSAYRSILAHGYADDLGGVFDVSG